MTEQNVEKVGIPPEQLEWDREEVEHAAAAYQAGLDMGLSAGYRMGLAMRTSPEKGVGS